MAKINNPGGKIHAAPNFSKNNIYTSNMTDDFAVRAAFSVAAQETPCAFTAHFRKARSSANPPPP
ncbi:hypothetical protein TAMA11512_20650 [Selenomonas sp. TAMA-11512]|nr:hypothetical protein TAMA11512_20650 [Selenomonas sp. TAMA-11512]